MHVDQSKKSQILNATDLVKACEGVMLFQAESMARKFIAEHPTDVAAWALLLNRLDRIGNYREMQRLAAQASALFPQHLSFKIDFAKALTINGRKNEALKMLQAHLNTLPALTLEQCLLYAETALANNPPLALSLFEEVLKHSPENMTAKLGTRCAKSLLKNPNTKPQVCFFQSSDWHFWVQSSIIDALELKNTPFTLARQDWLVGLLNPTVVVLSSPNDKSMRVLRSAAPIAQLINTRHGISVNGKNYGLYAAAACDYVCASSEAIANALCKYALLPPERVWTTGYPQMDKLFNTINTQASKTSGKAANHGRRVLFAPTFTQDMSAAYLIGDDPVKAIRGADESIEVILAPHPDLRILDPTLVRRWKQLAEEQPNATFFDSSAQNLIDYLPEVDILVSDVSSVAIQFLAINRPLVRYVNEARIANSNSNGHDGEEWDLAAVSHHVSNDQELADAVKRLLNEDVPLSLQQRRSEMQQMLFGSMTQGNAGEYIANNILALLEI